MGSLTLFELPEYTTLARQMNETLPGKIIQQGNLGNSPHKFVWYNRTHKEDDQVRIIADELTRLRGFEKSRETILVSIKEHGNLTDELR